jgi:hypothetical protein
MGDRTPARPPRILPGFKVMMAAQQIPHVWTKPRAQKVLAASRVLSRGHMKLAHPHQAGKPAPYTPRRASELTSQVLHSTLALWQRGCPDSDTPPAAGGFDILDYRHVVGCINLIEVCAPPLDFVFRVHSVTGSDYIGKDMTGRSVWDYPDSCYGGFVREVCRRAVREKRAQIVIEDVLVRRRQTSYDCPFRWEALILPLCDHKGAVTRLVFAFDLQRLA